MGIVRGKGRGHGVHFIGRFALAVHTYVQPEVEEVLVYVGIQLAATTVPYLGVSPASVPAVSTMSVSFISSCIVPSW